MEMKVWRMEVLMMVDYLVLVKSQHQRQGQSFLTSKQVVCDTLADKQRERQGFTKARKPTCANDSPVFFCVGVFDHESLCLGNRK